MNSIKIQIAIVCAVAVAALAMLFVQQGKMKALLAENEALKQQAAQVGALQEQLANANQSAAGGASASEEQTRELARLRNEVSQLRKQSNDLVKARQDILALQQRAAAQAEAAKGAVEQAQAQAQQQAQNTAQAAACINNLRLLDSVKKKWAADNGKQNTDTPTQQDLLPYLTAWPVCPDGGLYTIGAVGEKPSCNIPGHVLP